MARGVNLVILVGSLGRDPELKYSSNGLAICRLNLATTESQKVDGKWEDKTEWHRVTMFGKTAEAAGEYLQKGSQVYIEGRIQYGSYEKDGVKHYTTDIIANKMRMLGGKHSDGGGQTPKADKPFDPGEPEEDEEPLPF